jgi:hypothetical protein
MTDQWVKINQSEAALLAKIRQLSFDARPIGEFLEFLIQQNQSLEDARERLKRVPGPTLSEIIQRVTALEKEVGIAPPKVEGPSVTAIDDVLYQKILSDLQSSTRVGQMLVVFTGMLLESGQTPLKRQAVIKEFVKRGISDSEGQAGIHMSNVSQWIGRNPHWDEILEYEKPDVPWMKNNYRIKAKHLPHVRELFQEITQ